jgi:hypothetical protein
MCKIIILLAALLMVSACHDEQDPDKSAEEARIEKEVTRRVGIVETELKTRQTTLRTLRTIGFILLAGGAVAGLVRVRQSRFPNTLVRPATRHPVLPEWSDHYQPGPGRVIDPLSGDRPNDPHPHQPPKP